MFTDYFYKFLKFFAKGYEYKLILLLCLSIIAGFMEFIGIALIFPLIILILQPEQSYNIPYISSFITIENSRLAIFLLSVGVVGIFIVKNVFMIINTYYQTYILKNWQCSLDLLFFKKYLFSSYESKLTLPSKYSVFQVWQLCGITFCNFVSRVLNLMSNLIILSLILLFLVWKFKIWAIITCLFFLVTGLLQNKFFKTKVREYVRKQIRLMDEINKSILGAISNIKDIKIFAKEQYFYDEYSKCKSKMVKVEVLNDFYGAIPQNIVEITIILAIVIMSCGVVDFANSDSNKIVASFGMLAAAVFRMAPLVNKIQMHLNFIHSNKPIVQELFDAYMYYDKLEVNELNCKDRFNFKNIIEVKDIAYSYKDKQVFSNISMNIRKGEFIGIIGPSGVGKTTLVNVLMGLFVLNSGDVCVDGVKLKEKTAKEWLNTVGYVPQDITILPLSIAQNIAFGIDIEKINYDRVKEVVKLASLDDYVLQLENGVDTILNGQDSLSQGQKQRIGLARALYKNPSILFLDEVTSALDLETENKIMGCLNKLKGEITIVAIAHRLSTLKTCDRLYYLKSPTEFVTGTFMELFEKDASFNKLVELAALK